MIGYRPTAREYTIHVFRDYKSRWERVGGSGDIVESSLRWNIVNLLQQPAGNAGEPLVPNQGVNLLHTLGREEQTRACLLG